MRKFFTSILLVVLSLNTWATENRVETVDDVSGSVTLSDAVDYHISGTTPFGTLGVVNFTNTDEAVLVFDNVRPSDVIKMYGHIKINGSTVGSTSVQVRVHGHGSIVYPYSSSINPLTIYTAENYAGENSSDFAVGNSIYLNKDTYNNKIKSFKLKRGYMVCFATSQDGKGYSRVFVADDNDLYFPSLPGELKGKISLIRISKWNSTDKRGYAGNDVAANNLLNTTWCYNWDAGINPWDNREYVTQHHHEGWPSISDVGNNGTSANIIANNEPDNTADNREHLSTVDEVLANWPAMMATGKRLGSPAVSGNYSWLYQFIDSIDARGWRCDFICVHAYWYNDVASWKSTLQNIYNRTHRPIWITEMNYGANWTGWPGSDTSGSDENYNIEKQHFAPTIDFLNSSPFIERYAVYNWVQDCRKMYYTGDDGLVLTPMGEYYANAETSRGYNASYEYVPESPRTYAPPKLTFTFIPRTSICSLSWYDSNGEFNDSMIVERKTGTNGKWERLAAVTVDESANSYSYTDKISESGVYFYRIHCYLYDGSELYSEEVENIVNGTSGTADFQYGTIKTSSTTDSYNFFSSPFENIPAIVFGSPTGADTNVKPLEHFVGAYTIDGNYSYFKFNYYPWTLSGYQTFTKGNEFSSYLVSKVGNGKIGSLNYEAGYVKNGSGSELPVGNDSIEVTFNTPFAETPVVFATPRYSSSNYPYMWRVWDVTPTGFKLILQRQKGLDATISNFAKQRVAYIAIEKGCSSIDNGKVINVGTKNMTFTNLGSTEKLDYGTTVTNPLFLCQLQSYNRKVAAFLRTGSMGPRPEYCMVRMVPDSSDVDNCGMSRSNPFKEQVAWITVSDDTASGISELSEDYNPSLSVAMDGDCITVMDEESSLVSVFSVDGKKIISSKIINGSTKIDLSCQSNGIYIINTDTGKNYKFIKK